MTVCRIDVLDKAEALLKSEASRTLLRHFRDLRAAAGGALPVRAAIDPAALRTCLPSMAILDLADPRDPVYRLAGTDYSTCIGLDPTGRRYLELVPEVRRASAAEAYVAMAEHGCAMITNLVASGGTGRERLCEAVNVPVRETAADGPARLLYVVFTPLDDFGRSWDKAEFSNYRTVLFRAFVDLGAGTPANFGGGPVVPYDGGPVVAGGGRRIASG
jgi:hypothetical protein